MNSPRCRNSFPGGRSLHWAVLLTRGCIDGHTSHMAIHSMQNAFVGGTSNSRHWNIVVQFYTNNTVVPPHL